MRLRGKGRGINPSVEDIAQAIAKRDKAKIVPMGAEVRTHLIPLASDGFHNE